MLWKKKCYCRVFWSKKILKTYPVPLSITTVCGLFIIIPKSRLVAPTEKNFQSFCNKTWVSLRFEIKLFFAAKKLQILEKNGVPIIRAIRKHLYQLLLFQVCMFYVLSVHRGGYLRSIFHVLQQRYFESLKSINRGRPRRARHLPTTICQVYRGVHKFHRDRNPILSYQHRKLFRFQRRGRKSHSHSNFQILPVKKYLLPKKYLQPTIGLLQ